MNVGKQDSRDTGSICSTLKTTLEKRNLLTWMNYLAQQEYVISLVELTVNAKNAKMTIGFIQLCIRVHVWKYLFFLLHFYSKRTLYSLQIMFFKQIIILWIDCHLIFFKFWQIYYCNIVYFIRKFLLTALRYKEITSWNQTISYKKQKAASSLQMLITILPVNCISHHKALLAGHSLLTKYLWANWCMRHC